jgi:hypothetical protein
MPEAAVDEDGNTGAHEHYVDLTAQPGLNLPMDAVPQTASVKCSPYRKLRPGISFSLSLHRAALVRLRGLKYQVSGGSGHTLRSQLRAKASVPVLLNHNNYDVEGEGPSSRLSAEPQRAGRGQRAIP